MRLLFFTQPFLPILGGAERFLDGLARRLSERGHDVTVLAARVRGEDNRVDAPYRVIRYRKPFSKRFLPRHTILHLLRAHRIAKPDCLHAHGTFPQGYSAELFCRWMHIPWVVRPMGADIWPAHRFRPRFDPQIRRCLIGADLVVAQSHEFEEIVAGFGVPAERVERIPNGVELGAFAGPRTRRSEGPRIGMMGMFRPEKGFDLMLDAMPAILRRHPDAVLTIAGDGRERPRIEAQVRAKGLEQAVELVGVVHGEAKTRFLRGVSVYVSASRMEGLPNANIEALAAGAPMVVTAAGGNTDIVTDGWNGTIVPVGDSAALSRAVGEVLADPERLERYSENARAKAREYDWTTVVDRYERVYEEVAERAS